MRVNPSHLSPNLNFNLLQRIKIMQKLIKVNKANLENIVTYENRDLNLLAHQIRALKMQVESIDRLLDTLGIECYGSSYKQTSLKDYQIDDKDNFIVKTEERQY